MSKSKTSLQKMTVISNKDGPMRPVAAPPDFVKKMMFYPDSQEAGAIISEQAQLEWDKTHDGEIQRLELAQGEIEHELAGAEKHLSVLEHTLANTPQYIKRAGGDGAKPARMSFPDFLKCLLLAVFFVATLVMAGANVFANLMASGQSVFLENPWIAIALSLLVPGGSVAIKFIVDIFETHHARKRFCHFIYFLCAVMMLVWTISFALNFSGITAGIDWESLGEASAKGPFFTWVQLFTEVLVASALFLALSEILRKYNRDLYVESLEYINAKQARDAERAYVKELHIPHGENHARLEVLNADRSDYALQKLADFHALRARVQTITNL